MSECRRRPRRNALLVGAVFAVGAALVGKGGTWALAVPSPSTLPKGPVLARVVERGKLVAGVRSYPRPAPPGAPTPSEPDAFDATVARQVAVALGVSLELVGLDAAAQEQALRDGRVDVVIAGAALSSASIAHGIVATPGSYDEGRGQLVALRRGPVQTEASLRGAAVCVGAGSGYASTVAHRYGALPRSYPSSVHAASAFMAGECAALVEDGEVLARLLKNEEWRFYRPVAHELHQRADASIRLADGDAASLAYLAAVLRQWRGDGTLAKARGARAGNLQFEITLLKNGFVCHSY